jgi:CRISP-associated protein Cas1
MPAATRTYWLTKPCRIRRKDDSLVIERDEGANVHIPITDVRDIIAAAPVDLNSSVIALLNRNQIDVHFLSYYGDYAGSLTGADRQTSGHTVLAQVRLADSEPSRMAVARSIVTACAFNVRRVIDRSLLDEAYKTLVKKVAQSADTGQLMAQEGNYRRTAWAAFDTKLPDWLQLSGRTRKPPSNAGNAFISYVNGIIYARVLTAIRLTPLHSGIGFLHSSIERQRHALALDLAEVFKPLFAERLLLRLAARKQLEPGHFDSGVNQAMLSDTGRTFVVKAVRDELATTVTHRALGRKVAYDELLYLEALKLTRTCLEGEAYKPFQIWW